MGSSIGSIDGGPNFIISLIRGIILILLGVFITYNSYNYHQELIESYNCSFCSAFDKKCPDNFYTEENTQCLDSLEWPFKISAMFVFVGIILLLSPFALVFQEYYEYFKKKRKKKR